MKFDQRDLDNLCAIFNTPRGDWDDLDSEPDDECPELNPVAEAFKQARMRLGIRELLAESE